MPSFRSVALVPLLALLALAGCATEHGGAESASPPVLGAAALTGGFWRIQDAAAPTWVQFDATRAEVHRPAGFTDYDLASSGPAVVASLSGWSSALGRHARVPWLDRAASVAGTADRPVLLDADGRVLVRLVRDGKPPPARDHLVEAWPAPREPVREAPLGEGVHGSVAPTGTWHLRDFPDATLTFSGSGGWRSHPTCRSGTGANAAAGAWRALPGGRLLTTVGASTMIGCVEAAAPSPDRDALRSAGEARSYLVDGDRLTLFGLHGERLGTVER